MSIRIAVPEPTSKDAAYNLRCLPQYIAALQSAGAVPTIVPLHERRDRVERLLAGVQGVLLPGSGCDVDPESYGETRISACAEPDSGRAAVDELLLGGAFSLQKPVLAICYGIQSLNVWRKGSLIQDLAHEGMTATDHAPGRSILDAHAVRVIADSRLGRMVPQPVENLHVNSSHHQALRAPGDKLRVTAICPADGVIEAVELDSPDHFVVGVQSHPERSYAADVFSRRIFAAFVQSATQWKDRRVAESLATA